MENSLLSNKLTLIMNTSHKNKNLTFWLSAHDVIAHIGYVGTFKREEDRISVMLSRVYDNKHGTPTYPH